MGFMITYRKKALLLFILGTSSLGARATELCQDSLEDAQRVFALGGSREISRLVAMKGQKTCVDPTSITPSFACAVARSARKETERLKLMARAAPNAVGSGSDLIAAERQLETAQRLCPARFF